MNINSLTLSEGQKSKDIHLQAPHLSDKSQSNRPPIKPSKNLTRTKAKPKEMMNKDIINPCGDTYIKTNGTTCGLQDIMIGRCYEYEYIKHGFFLAKQS
jgi:hypothetical protein